MSAADRIRETRESKGISREQLAKKLKRERRWVWRIETGATKLRAEDLPRFARALGVEVAELVA
jgi:transcriptional regulator with XRE-family HTH domain